MRQLSLILAAMVITSSIYADGNFCRKCEVMREYHKNNPSKYEFYDDYLKDLEENGEGALTPDQEALPPDVRMIMKQEKVAADKSPVKGK